MSILYTNSFTPKQTDFGARLMQEGEMDFTQNQAKSTQYNQGTQSHTYLLKSHTKNSHTHINKHTNT